MELRIPAEILDKEGVDVQVLLVKSKRKEDTKLLLIPAGDKLSTWEKAKMLAKGECIVEHPS